LAKLNNGDMTQGIEFLNRSVSINKNNIPARNLLGLALFEIGYIGDALKHWVISQSLQKENNLAKDYLEEARKNSRALEALNDAAVKYNQSLVYLQQKSDDLAIIQLKRAVELNPRFVDALNLLTLCHLIQNNREKAAATAERVLDIDVQNTIALNYLSIVNPGRAKPDTRKVVLTRPGQKGHGGTKSAPATRYKGITVQEKKASSFRFDIILAFVIGAVCTFAVGYIMLMPAMARQHESQLQAYSNRLNEAGAARAADAEMHEQAILEMEAQAMLKEETIQDWEARYDRQDRIIRFHQADNLFRDEQLLDAIERLDNLDMTGLPRDMQERAEEIRESAYPRLATRFVNEGLAAMTARDYYKAMVDLELAHRFMAPTAPRRAEFLMALATLYAREEERHAEARELLEELQEEHPWHRAVTRQQLFDSLTDQE